MLGQARIRSFKVGGHRIIEEFFHGELVPGIYRDNALCGVSSEVEVGYVLKLTDS
jgi:hypothetical protein